MTAAARRTNRAATAFVLLGLLVFAMILGLSLFTWWSSGGPAERVTARRVSRLPGPIAPPTKATPPEVAPLEFARMTPDQARSFNAGVPVVSDHVPAAPPFRYPATDPGSRARAAACLAAAVLYEAGDEPKGEAAVAQVVLNRLRHPAFPKTVCGVVFQGSERKTGCQFTFTCDGALARTPSPAAWARARQIADRALDGRIVREVGTATHYHADYVVPYWGSSLAKIAVVTPHIFYRWPGAWGRPATLSGRPRGVELLDSRVAAFAGIDPGLPSDGLVADAEPGASRPALQTLSIAGVPPAALKGNVVRLKDEEAGQFVLQLDPFAFPGSFAIVGYTICSGRPNCIVMGWTGADELPRAFPILPRALRSLAFMYRRSSITDTAQPYWDCRRYPRPVASQCLKDTGQ